MTTYISRLLLRIAVHYKSPYFLSIWFLLSNRRLWNKRRHKKFVLFTKRPIFDDEIANLQQSTESIVFIPISARVIKEVFLSFLLDKNNRPHRFTDYNYESVSVKWQVELQALYRFWYKFSSILSRLKFLDAAISSGYYYYSQMELNRALVDQDIPFVAIFRETLQPDSQSEIHARSYLLETRFLGTVMLVYRQYYADLFLKLGIRGVNPKNIRAVGFPRSDRLFSYRNNNLIENKTLSCCLFITVPDDKLVTYMSEEAWRDNHPREALESFYFMVFDFFNETQQYSFSIKLKHANHRAYLSTLLTRYNRYDPTKFDIIAGGDPFPQLINSSVILGYNSTVLVEALVLNKTIIEPPILNKEYAEFDWFSSFPGVTNYVRTKEQLTDVIDNWQNHRPDRVQRDIALKKYLTFTDGLSTQRILDEIDETIGTI